MIRTLQPVPDHLQPVMTATLRPRHRAAQLLQGRPAAPRRRSRPVANTYAQLFVNMGTTFEALSRHPERLQGTIERLRPTLDEGIDSFPVQRPFLRDTARAVARGCGRWRSRSSARCRWCPTPSRWARRCRRRRRSSTATPQNVFDRARRPGVEPQHAARAARTSAHAGGGHAAGGVRGALPDGLQLLELLLDGDQRARVRERARRHRPAQHLEVGQQHPGQPRELHRGRPAGRRAGGRRTPRRPRTRAARRSRRCTAART